MRQISATDPFFHQIWYSIPRDNIFGMAAPNAASMDGARWDPSIHLNDFGYFLWCGIGRAEKLVHLFQGRIASLPAAR